MTAQQAVAELRAEFEHNNELIARNLIHIEHLDHETHEMELRNKEIKLKIKEIERGR